MGFATLLVVAYLPLHGGWRSVLALVVVGGVWRNIRVHALRRGAGAVVQLTWDSANHWFVSRRDGVAQQVTLLGDSLVLPWLVVLNFKTQTRRRFSVVLLADCVPPERFRQLRVRLRIADASASSGSDKIQL